MSQIGTNVNIELAPLGFYMVNDVAYINLLFVCVRVNSFMIPAFVI
jgi:hypothetical protein